MRSSFAAPLLTSVLGLSLAACTLEPHYVRPQPAVPTTWPTGPSFPANEPAVIPTLSYRDVFRDPKLLSLIDRALANNQNLRATVLNVQIARETYGIQRAASLPQLSAGGTGTEARALSSTTGADITTRSFAANLQIPRFEIDLFGQMRSLNHAAFDTYLSTAAGAQSARLTLVATVANAYLTLAADRSLLAISADTVASAQRTVDLTQARLTGGVAPRTDLTQAETLLDTARSDQQQRITQVAQDRDALDLLVGAPVTDQDLPADLESIDTLVGETPAGLDSRILLRRPDVLAAEYRLRSANASIGAARANFFPVISLTGTLGYLSPELSNLFSGPDQRRVWQGQSAVNLPIFAGGANVATLGRAKATRDQAVASYQYAVQSAFRDVADALARRGTIEAQLAAQNDLLQASTTSYNLQIARYREGISPYLNALDAQRTLYASRQTVVGTRRTRAQNLVSLYQVIGADPVIEAMPMPGGPRRPLGS